LFDFTYRYNFLIHISINQLVHINHILKIMLSLQDSLQYLDHSTSSAQKVCSLHIIYSCLFNEHTTHIFSTFNATCKCTTFMRHQMKHGHPSFTLRTIRNTFCTFLRTYSHHDHPSIVMSDLSDTSKSFFRHLAAIFSAVHAFCVRDNSSKCLFWCTGFISYLQTVDHNRLKTEFNFQSNMSKLTQWQWQL